MKIQVEDANHTGTVYIHHSRLAKVSTWCARMTARSDVIKLDSVRDGTVQAFYEWVYEGRLVVAGMREEMDEGDGSEDGDEEEDTSPAAVSVVVDFTARSENGEMAGGEEDDSDANSTTVKNSEQHDGQELRQ
jgi:hypothetical protein